MMRYSLSVRSGKFTRHAPKKWTEYKNLTEHHIVSAMLHGIGQVLPGGLLAPSQQSQYTEENKSQKGL